MMLEYHYTLEPRLGMGNTYCHGGHGIGSPEKTTEQETCKSNDFADVLRIYKSLNESSRWDVNHYLCTGILDNICITLDNAKDILCLCKCVAGLEELKKLCEKKLIQNVSSENMIEMLNVADTFCLPDLKEKTLDVINGNLFFLCQIPEFFNLTREQIGGIMSDPRIKCNSGAPGILYYWYIRDVESRREAYHEYSNSLHSSPNKSVSSESNNNNNGNENCRLYLASFTAAKNDKGVYCSKAVIREGVSGACHTVEVKKGELTGTHFAVCCQQRNVSEPPYVYLSGSEYAKHSQQMFQCDVVMGKWKMCARMKNGRCKHKMESINDRVYAFGGQNCGRNVPQIEEFDRKKNRWKEISQLRWNVHSIISAVFDGKVYLFGGKNENNDNVSVIQCFDPKKKTVEISGYLPYECSGGQAVNLEDGIYIATEQGHLLKFLPKTNSTHVCTAQPIRRKNFSLMLENSHISITDGFMQSEKGSNYACKHMYCLRTGEWKVETRSKRSNSVSVVDQCFIQTPLDVNHLPLMG